MMMTISLQALSLFLALSAPPANSGQPSPKTTAEQWIDAGMECYKKSADAKAVELFDKAVKADPNNAFALAMRGVARAAYAYYGYKTDDETPAENSPRRDAAPLRTGPGERVFADDAERNRTRRDLKLALGDVEKAVQLDQVDERLWLCRGVVYLWRSDVEDSTGTPNLDKALESLGQALLLNAECRDVYFYRAWAHLKHIPQKAYSRFQDYMMDKNVRLTV